jgi:hypothetical protein
LCKHIDPIRVGEIEFGLTPPDQTKYERDVLYHVKAPNFAHREKLARILFQRFEQPSHASCGKTKETENGEEKKFASANSIPFLHQMLPKELRILQENEQCFLDVDNKMLSRYVAVIARSVWSLWY